MSRVNGYKRGWAIRKYVQGELVKVITYQFNISQPTLYRALKAKGYPIRSRKINTASQETSRGGRDEQSDG